MHTDITDNERQRTLKHIEESAGSEKCIQSAELSVTGGVCEKAITGTAPCKNAYFSVCDVFYGLRDGDSESNKSGESGARLLEQVAGDNTGRVRIYEPPRITKHATSIS